MSQVLRRKGIHRQILMAMLNGIKKDEVRGRKKVKTKKAKEENREGTIRQ